MFKYKRLGIVGIICINILIFIPGCSQILNSAVGPEINSEIIESNNVEVSRFVITDMDKKVDFEKGTLIDLPQLLKGDTTAEGISCESGFIEIYQAGSFELSGEADNCRIIINVYDDEIVHLVLNNVTLQSENGPIIYVEQANKVIITLKEGTENFIADGNGYDTNAKACIFSNCDLTFNGNGKLNIYGYYHDTIRSKDRIKVLNAKLFIKSQNDGIRGNDGVICENSDIHIESKGTGIVTDNELGYVVISNGNCNIIAGENAISANDYVLIQNCEYNLYSVYELIHCNGIKEIDKNV